MKFPSYRHFMREVPRRSVPPLVGKHLRYLLKHFKSWKGENCPGLSDDEALEKYPGVSLSELLKKAE